jgi:hypothetical protein
MILVHYVAEYIQYIFKNVFTVYGCTCLGPILTYFQRALKILALHNFFFEKSL